jgi:hypothetical protein
MHWLTTILAVDDFEHAKTPFYVIGGALVAWALLLSAIGLRQPDFPRGAVAGRMVMGLGTLLVAVTLVTAVAVS